MANHIDTNKEHSTMNEHILPVDSKKEEEFHEQEEAKEEEVHEVHDEVGAIEMAEQPAVAQEISQDDEHHYQQQMGNEDEIYSFRMNSRKNTSLSPKKQGGWNLSGRLSDSSPRKAAYRDAILNYDRYAIKEQQKAATNIVNKWESEKQHIVNQREALRKREEERKRMHIELIQQEEKKRKAMQIIQKQEQLERDRINREKRIQQRIEQNLLAQKRLKDLEQREKISPSAHIRFQQEFEQRQRLHQEEQKQQKQNKPSPISQMGLDNHNIAYNNIRRNHQEAARQRAKNQYEQNCNLAAVSPTTKWYQDAKAELEIQKKQLEIEKEQKLQSLQRRKEYSSIVKEAFSPSIHGNGSARSKSPPFILGTLHLNPSRRAVPPLQALPEASDEVLQAQHQAVIRSAQTNAAWENPIGDIQNDYSLINAMREDYKASPEYQAKREHRSKYNQAIEEHRQRRINKERALRSELETEREELQYLLNHSQEGNAADFENAMRNVEKMKEIVNVVENRYQERKKKERNLLDLPVLSNDDSKALHYVKGTTEENEELVQTGKVMEMKVDLVKAKMDILEQLPVDANKSSRRTVRQSDEPSNVEDNSYPSPARSRKEQKSTREINWDKELEDTEELLEQAHNKTAEKKKWELENHGVLLETKYHPRIKSAQRNVVSEEEVEPELPTETAGFGEGEEGLVY